MIVIPMRAPSRSIRACRKAAGVVPTGAKVGIDATIPEGIPQRALRAHHLRLCRDARRSRITSNGKADEPGKAGDDAEVAALAKKILAAIGKAPLYYTDIAERFSSYDFRTVARALGHLHATEKLWQDPRGRMCVRGSQFAAKPPPRR